MDSVKKHATNNVEPYFCINNDQHIQDESKKVYSWKIFAKVTSEQNWRKLSVSPICLKSSGTALNLFRIISFCE